jgi:hypothetical protein
VVFACGSMVLNYCLFLVFSLAEQKTKNNKKEKHRSAEGYDSVHYATT